MATALEIGLLKSEEILKFVEKLTGHKDLSPEKVGVEIESVKNIANCG